MISMQGNWTVTVKSKNAAFAQRFVVSGAASGNGTYNGTVGTSATVTGSQWSIAIQNNPGSGFQASAAQIKFPKRVGGNYEFEIWTNDAGADKDFDDLILLCSTPAAINDFIVYGNVSLYSGRCIFNPCRRRGPFVIETPEALLDALKNPKLHAEISRLYPERIPLPHVPNPPDPPPYFKPIVLDVLGEATKPRTALAYKRIKSDVIKSDVKERKAVADASLNQFELIKTAQIASLPATAVSAANLELAAAIDKIIFGCRTEVGSNLTLSFDEYDRTPAEKAGGAYTGTGPRRALGDAVTDMNGNYIFRFTFDMSLPFLEDAADIASGEDVNVVVYPDLIVKLIEFSPYTVRYESAPYNNIPNLKRIDLCLPKSTAHPTSSCFNGNLIGSLGNVFVGGNQNSTGSFSPALLQRYGNSNFLEADGRVSVRSSLALFAVECAAWGGTIDIKGCMYDTAKPAAQNPIKWYTLRIKRAGSGGWEFISQNYKHPKFSNRNLPNYIGDNVGPFFPALHVDGGAAAATAAYINIQREIQADGIDWEFSNSDRYMQLNTTLYDELLGVTTPGTFYLRVDGYDAAGNPVPGAVDMIALYIHNLPMNYGLTGLSFPSDPTIVDVGCGLYRLAPGQMTTPMQFGFMANDPYGFVDSYSLTVGRCPGPTLALHFTSPASLPDVAAGASTVAQGNAATVSSTHPNANTHEEGCPGYTGTRADFSETGLVTVNFTPTSPETGWLRTGEQFSVLSFHLSAAMRVTNGYNTGVSSPLPVSNSIYLEPLAP